MRHVYLLTSLCATTLMLGCAENAPLGDSVTRLKTEQTYDQQATVANQGYTPQASGERMQPAVLIYQQTAAPQKLSGEKQGNTITVDLAQ